MPRSSYPPRGRWSAGTVLRTLGMVVGAGLIIVAVWLIVTSTTTKHQQIGVLVGLWGLLMAAFSAFGPRRTGSMDAAEMLGGSTELAVRPAPGGLGLIGDAEAVRSYEQQLRALIRQEIQDAFRDELSSLRQEVAVLRSEVVDKVGGQLRLERIETTRVIGSDIEALQQEVRQLQMARRAEAEARIEALTARREAVDAEIIEHQAAPQPLRWTAPPVASQPGPVDSGPIPQPEPTPVPQPEPMPVPQPEPIPQPEPMPIPQPEPMPIPQPEPMPIPQPEPPLSRPEVPAAHAAAHASHAEEQFWPWSAGAAAEPEAGDPFASMPRIRPFTDFELEPADTTAGPLPPGPPAGGRHAGAEGEQRRAGGRRRRESDAEDDMLSRILQRERGR